MDIVDGATFMSAACFRKDLRGVNEPTSNSLKATQVAINDVARTVIGQSRGDRVRIPDLLHRAGLPSLNQIAIKSVAIEAWKAFQSTDGGSDSCSCRRILGKMPNFTLLACDNITVDAENGMNCSFYLPEGSPELYEPSLGIVILLAVCYGGISLGAVVGNTLVIYMVIRSRRMRTITNFFIANLALSDVVIGTFSIPFQFQAALLQRWNLPEIMCSLCPFFQNVSVNTSIFTLIAIALDRYNAIIHPLRGKSSKKGTKIRIGFIWVTSILLAVPQVIAFRVMLVDGSIPQCIPVNISPTTLTWYMFALCFVQYFLPLALISFAYLRISMAIKVLMFVVSLFSVCWLPLQSYSVISVIAPRINEEENGSMTIYNGKYRPGAESISSAGDKNNELTRQDTTFFRPR
eukprot:maker-scaffold682_size112745-snap-gene-0.12 protein:Tk12396 transcript:maker-scaffold682_size112745-snap-gene-0.12-mRNA-1 annotation:"lymnokinin receptor"